MKTNKESLVREASVCSVAVILASFICGCLLTNDGTQTFDRAETLEWFRNHWFGRAPIGRPADEAFDVDGITCCDGRIRINVFLKMPIAVDGPVPVFVFGDHRRHPDPPHAKLVYENIPTNAIVSRGYAYVCWNFNDLAPDVAVQSDDYVRWAEGIQALTATGDQFARGVKRDKGDWGTIGAWAWGFSRVVDWIESRPELDSSRIAIIGHSRGGKTALWAGAQDERIALTISNDSGTGGARMLRQMYGKCETVKSINENFPQWFCPRFHEYADDPSALEHDADDLLKLIAPRLLYVASASEDPWAGPPGEFAAAKSASREWERRGLRGLSLEAFPEPGGEDGTGCVGYHLRPGRHKLLPYDWERYLDFADRHFKRRNATR